MSSPTTFKANVMTISDRKPRLRRGVPKVAWELSDATFWSLPLLHLPSISRRKRITGLGVDRTRGPSEQGGLEGKSKRECLRVTGLLL